MAKNLSTDDNQRLRAEAEAPFLRAPPASAGPSSTSDLLRELQAHQAELEESRDRYLDLFEFAPVGYLTLDKAGKVTDANLTGAALLGVERKGLVGRPFAGFVDPPDADRWQLFLGTVLHRDGESVCDLGLRRGDGSVFRGHLACRPRVVGESDPTVRVALSDVTERSQTEEVFAFLAQSIQPGQGVRFFDQLATFLARILHVDFVCIDRLSGDGLTAETLAVWCDGSFQDNVTYALKDTPCGDVVGKEVCCFPASVCQFFPDDVVLQELRAESYVGVTLWSHTGVPIGLIAVIGRSPLANPDVAAAVLKQVTVRSSTELERMETESALRESEARLRAFVDAIPGPVFLKDADSRWLVGNRALFDVVGRSAAAAIGKTDREIYDDPAVGDAVMVNDRRIMKSGVPEVVEETIPTPAGTRIFHSTKVPHRDASGRVVGIIGSALDITETRTLQGQLAVASRLAAMGTLVAGVAHEINNPLTGVMAGVGTAML
ncbi:MAG: PAS domain-containing protein, partial [Deltaproteobacteria bacterium]